MRWGHDLDYNIGVLHYNILNFAIFNYYYLLIVKTKCQQLLKNPIKESRKKLTGEDSKRPPENTKTLSSLTLTTFLPNKLVLSEEN